MTSNTLICDIETYHGFWLIAFKRISDGRVRTFEHSDRATFDPAMVRSIMLQNRIITFNGNSYDVPLIFFGLQCIADDPATANARIKQASDRIINGRVRYWEVEALLEIQIPRRLNHIDLIEPQPNAFASLKTLNGRLHGKKMQDLPIEPDAKLTHADMDLLTAYCGNDLDATELLFNALAEPLAMREVLSQEYGVNFLSKSDSQIGEGIIKKVVEKETGNRVERPKIRAGHSFPYKPPTFVEFTNPQLQGILERLRTTEFFIQSDGKVELPKWLDQTITIGSTTYAMGIGGLHSTESNRAVHADDDFAMYDVDVTGFYPQIIINSRMYPPAIGPEFCPVFASIKRDRDTLKPLIKDPSTPKADLPRIKAVVEGKKIVGNGVFGKTSSPYSSLYGPHLMVYTTLTGQLSILMLINRVTDAGMEVVSANTDGVVIRCPRHMTEGVDGDRFDGGRIKEVIEQWETDTGYKLEAVEYQSLYNQSVNTYIAVKPDGKTKRKGTLSNPWAEGDIRGQLMKNPNAVICSDAVVALIINGTPIETTIRAAKDVRDFVSVVNVKGGGTWRGDYLGKVVRYIWAIDGSEILYKAPHPTTGNFKKVPKTDGCRPLMELSDELPGDIDYDRYVAEAEEILLDIGYNYRAPPVKALRVPKYAAPLWWALAA